MVHYLCRLLYTGKYGEDHDLLIIRISNSSKSRYFHGNVGDRIFPGGDTKLHPVVWLQFWISEECEVLFRLDYSLIHSEPEY